MRRPAYGPGAHTPQAKIDTWHRATFAEGRSQRTACALAGISRTTGRELHYIARAEMAL